MGGLGPDARRLLTRPPLGALVLCSIVRSAGAIPLLVDLDRRWLEWGLELPMEQKLERSARLLAGLNADYYGFSTICTSYHITLRLCEALKRVAPNAIILLGGPQATATAVETMQSVPAVDFILAGEVDNTLAMFFERVRHAPEAVPGLCYRTGQGLEFELNPPGSPPDAATFLPPALDLWGEPIIPLLPVEAGRGCPYGCRFCSTSPFFGRRFRPRKAEVVLNECRHLAEQYGTGEIALINDHIAVDRGFLTELCDGWKADPLLSQIPFSCSLRPDSAKADVIEQLAGAGCRKVFLGVETGSQRMQRVVNKNLDISSVVPVAELLESKGITFTMAFIMGFPEETPEDLGQTLDLIQRLLLFPHMTLSLNVLGPLAGSAYERDFSQRLVFDGHFSGQVPHNLGMDEGGAQFMRRHPELCSADYSFPLEHHTAEYIGSLARFVRYVGTRLRLPAVAAARLCGGFAGLHSRWLSWREGCGSWDNEGYYSGQSFVGDFMAFLTALCNGPMADGCVPAQETDLHLLSMALEMQRAIDAAGDAANVPAESSHIRLTFESSLMPSRALARVPLSPTELAKALAGALLPGWRPVYLLVSPVTVRTTDDNGRMVPQWELEVRELNGVVQEILRRFEGGASLGNVVDSLLQRPPSADIPNTQSSWLHALATMVQQRYLVVLESGQ